MKIYIGEIVDSDLDLYADDDICPSKFRHELEGLGAGEDVELEITSIGGSVIAGNAIISQMREMQKAGHKVVAKVHGLAASMGSAIACAADTLVMDESAILMLHNPWTMVMGNQNDLRKEADTLDLLAKTLIATYKTKFPSKSEDEIAAMMDAETWILASEADAYGLVCEIDHTANEPMKIAAKWSKQLSNFKKLPRGLIMENEETKQADDQSVVEPKAEETKEETLVEELEEEKKEEEKEPEEEKTDDDVEELRKEIERLTEENEALKSKLAECEKKEENAEDAEVLNKEQIQARISGIQASMQKQINDFKSQLLAKEEELSAVKAELTSLNERLVKSAEELVSVKDELEQTTSALAEKSQALDMLNSSVNAQAEEVPTMEDGLAKCATPAEKVAFLKSGKYVK